MENLMFSLNATMPVFIMMVLGLIFRRMGILDGKTVEGINRFVFKIAIPAVLFEGLATADFAEMWDTKFVLFCFFSTFFGICIAALFSLLIREKSLRGEFIQASYRSSAAILGIAFIKNIYGTSGMAPLMIIGSVPLYNVMAVVVLSLTRPDQENIGSGVWKKTAKDIAANPIIWGVILGILWSVGRLPKPSIFMKTVGNLSNVATPLGLIAMGATFDWQRAGTRIKPAIGASFLKLVGICAVFLPMAVALGFRNEHLVAILVMLGSATTVSCFVMSRNMGHEGVLTSSTVAITTCASAFTLTLWLFLFKSLGLV